MSEKIKIYGKDTCPFTTAARDALAKSGKDIEYINVLANIGDLEEMLKYSNGQRRVPIIVEGENVSVGFRGKS